MSTAVPAKTNCHVSASTGEGTTVVWWERNTAGVFDAFIGGPDLSAPPMLAANSNAGHRGPTDITTDGSYVLYTQAEGWDRKTTGAEPGKGSQNSIYILDTYTRQATRLISFGPNQRGIIWPMFDNRDAPKRIAWARMLKTQFEINAPWGAWDLQIADIDLFSTPRAFNLRGWRLDNESAIYECYGWLPNSNKLIFQSSIQPTTGTSQLNRCQLWTIDDNFDRTTLKRITPPYVSAIPTCGQVEHDLFHEFVSFAPGNKDIMYTNIGAETVGGNDVFAYDLRTVNQNGVLAQKPKRVTFFGGDRDKNCVPYQKPGWPKPAYAAVTTRAWTPRGILQSVCPDPYCTKTNTWLINEGA